MRRRPAFLGMVAFAFVGMAVAHAESPSPIKIGWQGFVGNGGFRPKRLPRKEWAPIEMALSTEAGGTVGAHPPALTEIEFDLDRNVNVHAKGLPICPGPAQSYPAPDCAPALVGRGQMEVEIEFPESEPREVSANLFAYNGATRKGERLIWLHAFLGPPVSGELVIKSALSKESAGRYGTRWALEVPKIAGGYGWVKELALTIGRRFTYGGTRHGYLLAKCPDHHLSFRVAGVFSDGSTGTASFVRACTAEA